ncbi:MAG TPA: hypothetical protein VKY31_17265 [Terriglobia bacterium]|nr:hypothetical protein [Terriglobia bacterium]
MKRHLLTTLAALLIFSPRWAAGQARPQVLMPQVGIMAASGPGVSISTSGGVTFPAGNPTDQPVTPASASLIATVSISNPKNGNIWNLSLRSASSSFTGTTGAPISISNVHWAATANVTSGNGSVSTTSGQYLSTSDVVVASGLEGKTSPFTVQVTFTLTVNNSWNYDVDTYLQNLVLTATAN